MEKKHLEGKEYYNDDYTPNQSYLVGFDTIITMLGYMQNENKKLNFLTDLKNTFLQEHPMYYRYIPYDNKFDKKCDFEINKIKNQGENILNNLQKELPEKVKKKLGRKNVEPKPLNEYFHSLEKERILVFIEVLKKEFKNSEIKEFVYMIKALKELNCISYNTNTEIYQAFEKEFGKKYGTETAKNNQMINIDRVFQKIITDKIIRIKQSNNIY